MPVTAATRLPSIPRANVPFLDARTGLLTREWYSWLSQRNGQVDLQAIISGVLQVANGGTGLSEGTPGGVPAFTAADEMASTAAGTAFQVLHGGGAGMPTWSAVNLTNDTTGLLFPSKGGTGVTSATGTGGSVVLSNQATLVLPTLVTMTLENKLAWGHTFPLDGQPHVEAADTNAVAITATPTTIVDVDLALFWFVKDKTSGGIAVGHMDSTGAYTIVHNITGVLFTRAAGTGLQAQVTSGADPRNLSIFSIAFGPA